MIASVVPEALTPCAGMCREFFGCTATGRRREPRASPIPVAIDNPQEVGADRLVNAVAAHHRYSGPLIVVDFGTATTFDVVDDDGAYCGGVIAAGHQSFARGAAPGRRQAAADRRRAAAAA